MCFQMKTISLRFMKCKQIVLKNNFIFKRVLFLKTSIDDIIYKFNKTLNKKIIFTTFFGRV